MTRLAPARDRTLSLVRPVLRAYRKLAARAMGTCSGAVLGDAQLAAREAWRRMPPRVAHTPLLSHNGGARTCASHASAPTSPDRVSRIRTRVRSPATSQHPPTSVSSTPATYLFLPFAAMPPKSTASKAPPSTGGKAPASASKTTAAKKTSKAPAGGDSKKKVRSVRKETYSTYIYRVLKQVHPDTGISNKAMAILNSFVADIFGTFFPPHPSPHRFPLCAILQEPRELTCSKYFAEQNALPAKRPSWLPTTRRALSPRERSRLLCA